MKTVRMNQQRLKQVKKWCSQRNPEAIHLKCPKVESEYWLHSVINAIQDGVTVMDANYNILLQNETTRRLRIDQEALGQPCYKVHYGKDEPCINCHAMEAMKTGRLVKKEQPFQSKDSSGQTFEVYAYPITDEQGSITGVVEYLRDITELKQREQALQQSESRYESILDATNTGVWEFDSRRQMERLSTTYFNYLGYNPSEYMDEEGLTSPAFFSGIIHPEDRDQEMKAFEEYLNNGSPGVYQGTFRIQKKDGTWAWMMSRGKTLRDKEGKPTHITLGTMTDITQQIRFEKQIESINSIGLLANSTLELDEVLGSVLESTTSLVNSSVGMIFIKDQSTGRFCWGASRGLSEDFVENFKKNPIQLGEGLTGKIAQTGKPIFIPANSSNDLRINRPIVHKEGLHSFLGVPIFAGEEIIGVMNILTRPPMQLSDDDLNIISIVSGQVGLAIRNAQLYKQQKEANAELKESEEKFRQISDNIGEVFWLLNHDHTEMIYINQAYEQVWGRSCQSLYENAKSFMEAVHPEDQKIVFDEYDKYLKTGKFDREYRILRPDQTIRWVKVQSFPVKNDEGKVIRHTGIAVDITERKNVEEKLMEFTSALEEKNLDLAQTKEAAEAANKAKTQFLANMSHELRTPLNGLMGMLQLLQTTPLTEEQQEYTHIALGGSQSLTRVVEDILNYTSLERKTQKTVEEHFCLKELLQEVVGLHQVAAVHKGLFLNVNLDGSLPGQLRGDRFKLKQVLGNLLGNAIKFTENGVVQLSAIQASEKADEGHINICFKVSDTGVGIPPEKMDYIFQRFSQADESHTREYGGLGLGLAVAKEQTTMLGGTLTAESTPGQGSVFTLTCRVGLIQGTEPAPSSLQKGKVYDSQDGFSGIHVLVVDDDYSSRLMAQLHLEKMGCEVETAIDGQRALEKMAAKEYHLVFMDCQMPVMDGYEAARSIRGMEKVKDRHTPVIAMTAKVLPGDREKCTEAGMDGFLAKPIELDRLKAMVKRFTSEGRNGGL